MSDSEQHSLTNSQNLSPSPDNLCLTQQQFNKCFGHQPSLNSIGVCGRIRQNIRRKYTPGVACLHTGCGSLLPIIHWLSAYDIRSDLLSDVIAGVTTAIMHIPQGMAYAILAKIPAIHGIYMAFFQCILYAIFGTSKHISVGTFAVVCIMTGKVVEEHSSMDMESSGEVSHAPHRSPVLVASTAALTIGLVELVMFVLRMGTLTVLLSDILVKGFTTGAAVHVLMSQIKSLLGLELVSYNGAGKLLRTFYAILSKSFQSNPAVMVLSAFFIFLLVFCNSYVKPVFARVTIMPFPIELIVVVLGTFFSYYADFHHSYNIDIIGHIPTGVPSAVLPDLSLVPDILTDCVVIAIISYSVALSMSQLFARKHNYQVHAGQELVAHGMSNVISSFFSCAPMSASLSRSLILESVGGRTQLSGVITAAILLVVLLWLGPLFQTLPNCVLSSIIVVSLKGMFLQFSDLRRVWNTNKIDAFIWISTFFSVVCLDIDYGLAIGIFVSLVVLFYRHQHPHVCRLGQLPECQEYFDLQLYSKAVEPKGIRIIKFGGSIHFCNNGYFYSEVIRLTELDPNKRKIELAERRKQRYGADLPPTLATSSRGFARLFSCCVGLCKRRSQSCSANKFSARTNNDDDEAGHQTFGKTNMAFLEEQSGVVMEQPNGTRNGACSDMFSPDISICMSFRTLVFDMSCVAFVDSVSSSTIVAMIEDYQLLCIQCYLVGCNDCVLLTLKQAGCRLSEDKYFATVHSAVLFVQQQQQKQ